MNEKCITSSYWLLFMVLPAVISGGAVVIFSMPKWALAIVIVFFLLAGEHGLRKWREFLSNRNCHQ